MNPYIRKAHYYETDQMGVIHHANYIHWFEEARIDFMDQLGFGYKQMEEVGVVSPVLAVHCDYRRSVAFDDLLEILCGVAEFDGVRMTVRYEVRDHRSHEIRATGETKHCFLGQSGRPVSLKKAAPEYYIMFLNEKKRSES